MPAAGVLAVQRRWGAAIFMVAWGVFVVSGSDNVVRPLFISGRAQISTLPVFLGLAGGLSAFGPIGIVLGPVIVALVLALLRFAEESRQPALIVGRRGAAPALGAGGERSRVASHGDLERVRGDLRGGHRGRGDRLHLAVRRGVRGVVLVDERPPLTLTSDKSAERYRNWWPGPGDAMVAVMYRSIDLLEELARETGNVFRMNRRGYLFATADPARVPLFHRAAEEAAALGSGPVREHATAEPYAPAAADGFDSPLTGADVITEPSLIRRHFPYLTPDTSRSCTRAAAAGSAASSSACTSSSGPASTASSSPRGGSRRSTRPADACAACTSPGRAVAA